MGQDWGVTSPLERFSAPTREWFSAAFAEPTPAQAGAWEAISHGRHALVVAPTGSGKTLSAFLWSLDRLLTSDPVEKQKRCRVLYVSPLKALAVDVERNLRAPLTGIRHTAERLGERLPEVTVGLRSGDTSAADRRRLTTTPPDVLITTPESLFLMLTSQARESLRGVETVIVDEVHAVAGTKRGAHLAVSLERLDALLERPAQRIGLSATVRPHEEVARFLGGQAAGRGGGAAEREGVGPQGRRPRRGHVRPRAVRRSESPGGPEPEPVDLAPRRGARRRPGRGPPLDDRVRQQPSARRAADGPAQRDRGRPGRRRAARRRHATGRDHGPVGAFRGRGAGPGHGPPRVGVQGAAGPDRGRPQARPAARRRRDQQPRARHRHGRGRPRRPDRVTTERGERAAAGRPRRPPGRRDQPRRAVPQAPRRPRPDRGRRAADARGRDREPAHPDQPARRPGPAGRRRGGRRGPRRRRALRAVPPQRPVRLAPPQRLRRHARPAERPLPLRRVRRAAAPDRLGPGHRAADRPPRRPAAGRHQRRHHPRPRALRRLPRRRRARAGGSASSTRRWSTSRASATCSPSAPPAGGSRTSPTTGCWSPPPRASPGRLPFWKGDALGRPAELGEAVGAFTRELAAMPPADAERTAQDAGLDAYAAGNLVTYLTEQVEATRTLPSDRSLVVERFRDELGDWRLVVHSPYGTPVHAPWALAINARLRERYGIDGQAVASDDGIVVRIPDTDAEPPTGEVVAFEPDEIEQLVTSEVGSSALFASRFRECAARALLLPRRDPGRRSPLWQQRQRSAALLEVAARYPSFPIVLEAVRECLQDVYDLPGLVALMRRVERREVAVVDVSTTQPSPYARSLLFGYVAQFVYEGDSPLAERRAAALSLDQGLLAELLGRAELRELLDPEVLAEVEAELQRLAPDRRARDAEGVADLLRMLGPLTTAEVRERSVDDADVDELAGDPGRRPPGRRRCGSPARSTGRSSRTSAGCATRSASRCRPGRPRCSPTRSTTRWPTWSPGSPAPTARSPPTRSPPGSASAVAVARHTLERLAAQGRVLDGEFRPAGVRHRVVRRRGAAPAAPPLAGPAAAGDRAGRAAGAGPVPRAPGSTSGGRPRGVDGVLTVVGQLAGCPVPASALEPLVLGARVRRLRAGLPRRAHLHRRGDLGRPRLAARHRRLGVAPPRRPGAADAARARALRAPSELHQAVLDALAPGGAWFFRQLGQAVQATPATPPSAGALWDLVWAGRVGNDTLAPLRSLVSSGRGSHRSRRPGPAGGPQRTTPHRRPLGAAARRSTPTRPGAPTRRPSGCSTGTAWSPAARCRARAPPAGSPPSTRCSRRSRTPAAAAAATSWPASAPPSSAPPGPSTGCARSPRPAPTTSRSPSALAATDPANPYGAALPWPAASGSSHRDRPPPGPQGRRAGGARRRRADALRRARRPHPAHLVRRARPAHAGGRGAGDRRPARPARPADRREGRRLPAARLRDRRRCARRSPSAGFVATPRGLRLRA